MVRSEDIQTHRTQRRLHQEEVRPSAGDHPDQREHLRILKFDGELRVLLTMKELQVATGLGETTIRQLVTDGYLHPVRFGRAVRYRLKEVEALVDQLADV